LSKNVCSFSSVLPENSANSENGLKDLFISVFPKRCKLFRVLALERTTYSQFLKSIPVSQDAIITTFYSLCATCARLWHHSSYWELCHIAPEFLFDCHTMRLCSNCYIEILWFQQKHNISFDVSIYPLLVWTVSCSGSVPFVLKSFSLIFPPCHIFDLIFNWSDILRLHIVLAFDLFYVRC
jgi:hypothetical protein